ncbi:branched-chain amino acid transport system substrate-binding protein [Rhizobium petrolearium]|uniref:ABC transporter substrate-binding protein n=2 Tax=Neorhizobium TaxID=1525371 RepID=A0ABV0MD91_9HYPH|nr:ABC transporter substrate-binding protein [Neorhizobium petrolearium]MBP1848410.1 branched-chain amino acid transport system substrate-binding protein [Neorhizobium petrolearium]MCC2614279.1 ABC transporter substrate-binding protein [Neorhizobium petrolearium]WGI72384.1 ABC transporter substrate-binding protein [Neorhizobium petrolearium]
MKLKGLLLACALVSLHDPAWAETAVKLGVLTDLSGPYADLSGKGSVIATQMAAEEFQKSHPDFKIEVISADHQNKPDVGSAVVRKWFDQDGVDAVVDVASSAVALAVSKLAADSDKVFLASGPASSDITNKSCSANTVQWTYDTYALSKGTGDALARSGGDKWFFVTADYAFGHAMERDTSRFVEAAGGKVLGSVRHPINTPDFSSYLLQAQSSGANVVGLANAGADTINAVKQAAEFGLTASGIKLAGLLVFITDVHSLGIQTAQGLVVTEAFYWDLNDGTRAFSTRFAERAGGKMPGQVHAGAYSATLHYLKALAAVGSKTDGRAVVAKMEELPTEDEAFGKGTVRKDGRKLHDMYLFEVKKPEDSKTPWDLYNKLATIPADQAFRPVSESECALLR